MIKSPKYNIPLNVPYLKGNEKIYMNKCIDSNWVSSVGPNVTKFEKAFAKNTNTKYAIACSSGTAALHLALLSLNIGKKDLILVPSLTFVATVNAINYVGASPIIVDIDYRSSHIDCNVLKNFFLKSCTIKNGKCIHKETNKTVACILVAHILGHGSELLEIKKIANKNNVYLIEDAAEAVGVSYKSKKLGSVGKIGCFSFNGNKIITTGSGGMVVTNSKLIARKVRYLSTQAKESGTEFIHKEVGYNYRMSNIHASLGLAQLEKLNNILKHKRKIANTYINYFKKIKGISWVKPIENINSSWWLFTILIDQDITKIPAKVISKKLNDLGIHTRRLWRPIHLLNPYKKSLKLGGNNSIDIYQNAISLPSSAGMKELDQKKVVKEILAIINKKF